MARPTCPPVVNYLIFAIAILLAGYVGMMLMGRGSFVASEGFSGGETAIAAAAKGAGNPCQKNADCVSNFCARVDSERMTCY